MYFYMNLQGYMNQLMANGQELAEAFKRAMPPFYAFGASIANADFARFFIFFVWAVTPFVLALMLLGAKYGQVLTSSKGVPKTAYKERDIPAKTQLRALVGKEMAKFWSRPMVVMNSSIGSVFLLLSPLALVPQAGIMQQIETFSQMLNIPISVMFAAILAFLGSANTLSASLVSLEGKSLWIVKSVPIASKTILQAKIITHLLVSSIPCLFASAFFSLSGSAGDALLIFIVPQTAIVFMANLGIAINLFFPKLDWTNETYVVKQGISAMIALFGGMALFAGLGILYALALSSVLPATLFLWICAIVFAIVGAAAYSWLMKRGAIMFSELS
jgi:ABC-2 type transport system permease protein